MLKLQIWQMRTSGDYIILKTYPRSTKKMPRHGKQRTPSQKSQTHEMRKHRLVLGPSSSVNALDPVDPRAISKQRKKHLKEIKVQQQLARAAHKREERLKEKVDSQQKVITSLNEGLRRHSTVDHRTSFLWCRNSTRAGVQVRMNV